MDQYVDRSMEIVNRIYAIMEEINMSQKDLAKELKKTESEVSKWLSGVHNITLKSLAKLEIALGRSIMIPIGGTEYLGVLDRAKEEANASLQTSINSMYVHSPVHLMGSDYNVVLESKVLYGERAVIINGLMSTNVFNVSASLWHVGFHSPVEDSKKENLGDWLELCVNKRKVY